MAADADGSSAAAAAGALHGHVIIAGYGVPGRAAGEVLAARGEPFCVIELNPATVERCAHGGVHIIEGDVCNEQTLRRAGADRAHLLILAVPSDAAVLEAMALARGLNPAIRIVARCRFISSGMEAHRRGADEVVVEEQVVARELKRVLEAAPAMVAASGQASTDRSNP